ncbi:MULTISPECIES: DUF2569 domain-containing protein [Providencia]|uniref:DUF2569 domain-containing protein n=1 Tax=Providencia huaxiensis TaxID=2027290 RepID=A0ABU2J0Y3_9GAMM|nr:MULTISPECIES: DUF2569 domain-containing protein [Providencia]MBZ3681279.1 DUF2569 domain-containing protein [Providencia rettgeri]AXH62405.1 DUF2569 domain-containing protein [Providencia huaxiensis]MCD2529044.1 DUF2569 domain-containing protein [Providencia huaxiensis]MDT0134684.1 DUF2569 domain-containing protein [Providencia huaxiensis]MDT1981089.1 DUF2569 domain-containing protein [Providencia huaxiensis]
MKCINCNEHEANKASGWCNACEELKVHRINGVLYLPALGLIITAFLSIFGEYQLIQVAVYYAENTRSIPLFYLGALGLQLAYIIMTLIACWFFFNKKKATKVVMITYYILALIVTLYFTVFLAVLYGAKLTNTDYKQIITSAFSAAIWIGYFLKSERIAQVFTR